MSKAFEQTVETLFSGAIDAHQYIASTKQGLSSLGFHAENSIACVGLCRDEICRPLAGEAENAWGQTFNFSSLGGMLLLGRTGFGAAHAHSPIVNGRERYVYYCMPHIAIGADGEVGRCTRPGRDQASTACGALAALCSELAEGGRVQTGRDNDDIEQCLLRERLVREVPWGGAPDLAELTRIAYRAITADLKRMTENTVDLERADYAAFTGIQIHGPRGQTLVWPGAHFAVVDGKTQDFQWLPPAK